MAIDIGDLTAFVAAAREGSFGRAASSLLVSQPAVSERIARLERDVGAALFARGPRGTTLTPAGERLLPLVHRVFGLLDEATEAARAAEQPTPLRVAVHVTFAHRALPVLTDVLDAPRRGVTIRDAHSDEVIAMLLDGAADIGFVLPGARPPRLRFVAMPPEVIVAVCSPRHPLAKVPRPSLQQLAGHLIAINRWGSGADAAIEMLTTSGIQPWTWSECSDALTAIRLARHHEHVAFVPESLVADDIAAGGLVRLRLRPSLRWTVPLSLAYEARRSHDETIAAIHGAVVALRSAARSPEGAMT